MMAYKRRHKIDYLDCYNIVMKRLNMKGCKGKNTKNKAGVHSHCPAGCRPRTAHSLAWCVPPLKTGRLPSHRNDRERESAKENKGKEKHLVRRQFISFPEEMLE